MKKILIPLLMLFSCQSAFAISGKDAEHYMSREPMRKEYAKSVAQATERNLAKIRNQTSSGVSKSVISQINSSSTVSDGSKVTGGATVTKPVDPKAVAKTMAKRLEKAKALGKASLPSFLGSAALTALINGVGWVMDEGGNVRRKYIPDSCGSDGSGCPTASVLYYSLNYASSTGYKTSPSAVESSVVAYLTNKYEPFTYKSQGIIAQSIGSSDYGYFLIDSYNKDGVFQSTSADRINKKNNPAYSSSSVPTYVNVSQDELESAITNYITNNDNSITNNIVNNAYNYDSSNFATPSSDSNALVVDSHRDLSTAIDNASTAPYNADKPTQGYYKITDGTKTIEGYVNNPNTIGSTDTEIESTTTTNPDGSTTSTGTSSSNFQLPAFCDWASIMCDWYEDFKEFVKEDDQEDEQAIEPDTSILDREFDTDFNMSGQCPPDPVIPMPMGLSLELPFSKICDFFSYLKFGVITAASLLSGWILYGAVNKGAE